MSEKSKACTRCGEMKPATAEYFHRASHRPDGLFTICKDCRRGPCAEYYRANADSIKERRRAWYWANRDTAIEMSREYYQKNKERALELSREWVSNNRELSREIKADWRRRNPEKMADARSKWKRENPDKLREYDQRRRAAKRGALVDGVVVTDEAIAGRFSMFGNRCYICGASDSPMTVDHVIPLSRGGLHVPANIRPACGPCNSGKCDSDWRDVRRADMRVGLATGVMVGHLDTVERWHGEVG